MIIPRSIFVGASKRPGFRWHWDDLRSIAGVLFLSALFPSAPHCGPPFRRGEVKFLDSFPAGERALKNLLEKGFVVVGGGGGEMPDLYDKKWSSLPVFVTTDAAWDAYSVALEGAFQAGEARKPGALYSLLQGLFEKCVERKDSAHTKLARYLAVPILLLREGDREELFWALGAEGAAQVKTALSGVSRSIQEGKSFSPDYSSASCCKAR